MGLLLYKYNVKWAGAASSHHLQQCELPGKFKDKRDVRWLQVTVAREVSNTSQGKHERPTSSFAPAAIFTKESLDLKRIENKGILNRELRLSRYNHIRYLYTFIQAVTLTFNNAFMQWDIHYWGNSFVVKNPLKQCYTAQYVYTNLS